MPAAHQKLSRRLEDWWTLDFGSFRAEVKRVSRTEIPVKERGEWEAYLTEQAGAVRKLNTDIEAAERELNTIVYRLFELSSQDIALLESSMTM